MLPHPQPLLKGRDHHLPQHGAPGLSRNSMGNPVERNSSQSFQNLECRHQHLHQSCLPPASKLSLSQWISIYDQRVEIRDVDVPVQICIAISRIEQIQYQLVHIILIDGTIRFEIERCLGGPDVGIDQVDVRCVDLTVVIDVTVMSWRTRDGQRPAIECTANRSGMCIV